MFLEGLHNHHLGTLEIDRGIHRLLSVIPGIPGRPTQGNGLRRTTGVGLLGIPDATGLETGNIAVALQLDHSEMDLQILEVSIFNLDCLKVLPQTDPLRDKWIHQEINTDRDLCLMKHRIKMINCHRNKQ